MQYIGRTDAVFCRSSRPEVFCKKGVLRNFEKFTGKHLCQSIFFSNLLLAVNCNKANTDEPYFVKQILLKILGGGKFHTFEGNFQRKYPLKQQQQQLK